MRFTSDLKTTLAIPFLTVVLVGCGDLIEEGPTCDGVRMIEDNTDASIAAGDIASSIEEAARQLINDSYTDELLSGSSGTISITGTIISTLNEDCGPDCLTSYNNHTITAALSNYSVALGDARLSGIVIYADTTRFTQSSSGDFTSGSISILDNGSFINYDATVTEPLCNPATNGIVDTISKINSSGPSSSFSDQSGSLTTVSGGSFTF